VAAPLLEGFRQGLREQGYREGSNIEIEFRFAKGRFDRLPELAAELVRLHVKILVTAVTQASLAAKRATGTIPIVMIGVADPVGAKLVASLARPGGNVTGNSSISAETAGKSLELLREVLPHVRRVAVLWNPANLAFQSQMLRATEAAARSLEVRLLVLGAQNGGAIDAAFARAVTERAEAVIVLPDPTLAAHARRLATLAIEHHLASVSGDLAYAEAGGLMAYGPSFRELHRSAATYVARILKGARPADLPVEQPTKFQLLVNRRTADQLGLTIPPSLLLRVDRTIE
jgi:putative ABC transport system substrate-binding protein